jgi:hypothetical protein
MWFVYAIGVVVVLSLFLSMLSSPPPRYGAGGADLPRNWREFHKTSLSGGSGIPYTFSGTTNGLRYGRVNILLASASPTAVMVAGSNWMVRPRR